MIRSAIGADLAAVEAMLAEADLPLDGVRENFSNFMVAEEHGSIVGAVGIEKFDSAALLRSAVVSRERRSTGIGRQLIDEILARTGKAGIGEIYLLTTTAETYFPRFGFGRMDRDAVPEAVQASAEFRGACPDTAIVMARYKAKGTDEGK